MLRNPATTWSLQRLSVVESGQSAFDGSGIAVALEHRQHILRRADRRPVRLRGVNSQPNPIAPSSVADKAVSYRLQKYLPTAALDFRRNGSQFRNALGGFDETDIGARLKVAFTRSIAA